ncbi:MAG: OmpA family protein [Alistipes sp.]|nr:OmpA family protein [Alistipes sp.]
MKKILLICALGLMALTAGAQEVAKKPSFKGFVNNGFWDNWEVSLGGGMNYVGWNDLGFRNQTNTGDNVGWVLEGSVTKWFNPVVGARLGMWGGRLNMSNGKGDAFGQDYLMPHFDGVVNLSNWIGGYREDRVYYAKLFAGFGVNITDVNEQDFTGFAFDAGLLNTVRLSPRFDLNLELRAVLSATKDMPMPIQEIGGEYSQIYSATLGLAYRFGKRDWERGVPGYTADDIKAFQDAVAAGAAAAAAANADKAKLAKQLKDTQDALKAAQDDAAAAAAEAAKAKEALKNKSDNPFQSVILYDLGVSDLSSKERTRLELMADMIKNGPSDRVYKLEGHADKQTGTAEVNKRIAAARAKKAYDFLVSKGVNPDQLTYDSYGDTANPYNGAKANRVVVIK